MWLIVIGSMRFVMLFIVLILIVFFVKLCIVLSFLCVCLVLCCSSVVCGSSVLLNVVSCMFFEWCLNSGVLICFFSCFRIWFNVGCVMCSVLVVWLRLLDVMIVVNVCNCWRLKVMLNCNGFL